MRMTSGFELGGAFRILASSCPLFDLRPRMLVSHRFKFVGRLRGEHLVVFVLSVLFFILEFFVTGSADIWGSQPRFKEVKEAPYGKSKQP